MALLDSQSGRVKKELPLPGLDDVLHPSFAPDGLSIVFSGNRGGLMDLYRIDLATGALEPLTNDPFADLEPVVHAGWHVPAVRDRTVQRQPRHARAPVRCGSRGSI